MTTTFKPVGRIQECCDTESSRYALSAVQVQKNCTGVWVSATDGRVAAVVKMEGETDKTTLVPAAAFPKKKPTRGRVPAVYEEQPGYFGNNVDDKRPVPAQEGRFPQLRDAFPDCTGRMTLCIDPRLLVKLADALATEEWKGLTLMFEPTGQTAIGVYGALGIGVLMPIQGMDNAIEAYEELRKQYSEDSHRNATEEAEAKRKESEACQKTDKSLMDELCGSGTE